MRNAIIVLAIIVAGAAGWLFFNVTRTQQKQHRQTLFEDEAAAHSLYNKTIETMRKAETLSYTSDYKWESKGKELGHCTYTIWMKKPNYFRVETTKANGEKGGTLIGDGDYLWIYWPKDRPFFSTEDKDDYKKASSNVYMKEPTPIGKHSIGHKTGLLGAGMSMTIIDPSTFHGYTNSLQPHIDGVRSMGTEKVRDEECNVVEASIMNHQRSWYLWLSKKDNLPRKLKEIVRVGYDIITRELWSDVTLNAQIPTDKFSWIPPQGWKQWKMPSLDEKLPKPGYVAVDFNLLSIDGGKIKLSDYRGKVVWLTIWRVGCPPCRKEMPYLEKLYNKFKNKGFIVLGFNCADDKKIAMDFLHEYSVTFPNILDTSDASVKIAFRDYNAGGVPVNYIIDREGKIAAAWYGYDPNDTKGVDMLKKLGVK